MRNPVTYIAIVTGLFFAVFFTWNIIYRVPDLKHACNKHNMRLYALGVKGDYACVTKEGQLFQVPED